MGLLQRLFPYSSIQTSLPDQRKLAEPGSAKADEFSISRSQELLPKPAYILGLLY